MGHYDSDENLTCTGHSEIYLQLFFLTDWLACNQNNVFEWRNISTHRLLFQCASTIKIQLRVLV